MPNIHSHILIKTFLNDPLFLHKTITVKGWVRSRRDSKEGFSFITLSDGSCFDTLQVIADKNLPNYTSEVKLLSKDCSVSITGTLIPSQGGAQAVELQAQNIEVLGWIEDPKTYPISPKRHTVEHLREHAHLRVRTNLISSISRVRHQVAHAIHHFFHMHDFLWVNTPILTANDCEGAGELFTLSNQTFFNESVHLTVSGQLNGETYASGLSRIYTFGPTFRAENSNTSRHLAEFWMVEPEMAFHDLQDNANLAEALLKYVIETVLEKNSDDIAFFDHRVSPGLLEKLSHITTQSFEQLTYTKAIQILEKTDHTFEYPVHWGLDLQSEHERYLAEIYFKKPVILTDYPKEIKAFYMRMNDDDKTVAAMDVLVPGIGEIIGGSQREERLEHLDQRMAEMNIDAERLYWYRDLRRYGTVPHSGFGLGFERLLGYITGVQNVRDLIPFPRIPGSANF